MPFSRLHRRRRRSSPCDHHHHNKEWSRNIMETRPLGNLLLLFLALCHFFLTFCYFVLTRINLSKKSFYLFCVRWCNLYTYFSFEFVNKTLLHIHSPKLQRFLLFILDSHSLHDYIFRLGVNNRSASMYYYVIFEWIWGHKNGLPLL